MLSDDDLQLTVEIVEHLKDELGYCRLITDERGVILEYKYLRGESPFGYHKRFDPIHRDTDAALIANKLGVLNQWRSHLNNRELCKRYVSHIAEVALRKELQGD